MSLKGLLATTAELRRLSSSFSKGVTTKTYTSVTSTLKCRIYIDKGERKLEGEGGVDVLEYKLLTISSTPQVDDIVVDSSNRYKIKSLYETYKRKGINHYQYRMQRTDEGDL